MLVIVGQNPVDKQTTFSIEVVDSACIIRTFAEGPDGTRLCVYLETLEGKATIVNRSFKS